MSKFIFRKHLYLNDPDLEYDQDKHTYKWPDGADGREALFEDVDDMGALIADNGALIIVHKDWCEEVQYADK